MNLLHVRRRAGTKDAGALHVRLASLPAPDAHQAKVPMRGRSERKVPTCGHSEERRGRVLKAVLKTGCRYYIMLGRCRVDQSRWPPTGDFTQACNHQLEQGMQ